MNILLVRLSAIGDCTLVLPVVRAILKQKPEATITWLIGKGAYQLLKDSTHPRLKYIAIDKPSSIADYRALKSKLNKSYDVLLAMQASTRANLIYPLVKATRKIGFDKTRARELQWLFTNERIQFRLEHLHDSFCQFAHKLAVDTTELNWRINVKSNVKSNVTSTQDEFNLPSKYVAINPAASKLERTWPAQRYAEVIEYCNREYQLPVVLTGGSVEFELSLARDIEQQCSVEVINLVGKTGLQQLAAILDRAVVCVAPDTGPAHIANAMQTSVIGLYAVAPSRLSGPYLYPELTVDKYEEAVRTFLRKNPSQVPWRTRVHDQRAMSLISVDEVTQNIDRVINGLEPNQA